MPEFRILQDSQVVAGSFSKDRDAALSEAMHYALVYEQDGPVELQEKLTSTGGRAKWVTIATRQSSTEQKVGQ